MCETAARRSRQAFAKKRPGAESDHLRQSARVGAAARLLPRRGDSGRAHRLHRRAGRAGSARAVVGGADVEAQADQVFRNLGAALASVGCTPRELVKLTVFVRDMSRLAAYREARDRFSDEFLIEIEAVAAAT